MTFIWPENLFYLLIIPLLIGLYLVFLRRRRGTSNAFTALESTPAEGAARKPGFRRHIPPILFLTALSILLLSLSRPQMVVSLPKLESTIVLAFDVSGSMAAEDFKPNRIAVIKSTVYKFIEKLPITTRIGVVSFSDQGFAVLQPTNQKENVVAAISRLEPQKGTSLGSGILSAVKTITSVSEQDPAGASNEPLTAPTQPGSPTQPPAQYPSAMIILLTDGENNEDPDPLAAAKTASDSSIRIHTVGIGSPAGTILHINGFTVRTRLNEDLLKNISNLTNGKYYRAGDADQLQQIFTDLEPQLVVRKENTEVTSLFSGASILVFLVGAMLSFIWFNRLP